MTDRTRAPNAKVGKLRPSQVVTQHGPGAVVDLPELSVIVAGTNHWRPDGSDRVLEPRLEAFLRVRAIYRPPQAGPGKFGGLPSFLFPEWLVCPRCRQLAHYRDFQFRSRSGEFVCIRDDARHRNMTPTVFPARFLVACAAGHLDDFPWRDWVHSNSAPCSGPLELVDTGTSGSASDLIVKCVSCRSTKPLGTAFQKGAVGTCTGRRPWLSPRNYQPGCVETAKTILRGASNAYFAVVSSALSIPPWSDPIQQDIAPYREALLHAKSLEKLKSGIEGDFYDIGDLRDRYTVEDLWKALQAEAPAEEDLKRREYVAFMHPETKPDPRTEFQVEQRPVHDRHRDRVSKVIAVSRLREVRALRGFTRIDSVPDLGERTDVSELEIRLARVGPRDTGWLPGVDLRGEGVFLQLGEVKLNEWESRLAVSQEATRLAGQYIDWRRNRSLDDRPFPGVRYVLLHTLAHALIRQLSLDCGYSSSSLRERIYCARGNEPMAGVLVYTATSDSDGSLGGLVDQAAPDRLGAILTDAFRDAGYCASDPLCGGRDIAAATNLNGAACHACLFLAETSCEFANRLLDRAMLVETLGDRGMAFFGTA